MNISKKIGCQALQDASYTPSVVFDGLDTEWGSRASDEMKEIPHFNEDDINQVIKFKNLLNMCNQRKKNPNRNSTNGIRNSAQMTNSITQHRYSGMMTEQSDCTLRRNATGESKTKRNKWINKDQKSNVSKTFKYHSNLSLQDIIHKVKVKKITNNFIKQAKRAIITNKNVQLPTELTNQDSQESTHLQGFQLNQTLKHVIEVISIVFTITLLFVGSLRVVFSDNLDQIGLYLSIAGCIFYPLQFIIKTSSIKTLQGRRISSLRRLWSIAKCSQLSSEFLSFSFLLLSVFQSQIQKYLGLVILTKISTLLRNIEQVEARYISTSYKEQFWSLTKVFLFNFVFAHILSILLLTMGKIEGSQGWIYSHTLQSRPWQQQYIWAYYWGINIMLTVGFGDFTATNCNEAVCLIFIETFSCIILAFNVSCVGQIILNIRERQQQQRQQRKVFQQLAREGELSDSLNWRVGTFIEQSVKLRKKFNFQQQNRFISALPPYLRGDFLKQFNRHLFSSLAFFRYSMEKTILSLSEQIHMRMAHPQQVLRHHREDFNLLVLRRGEIATLCRKPQSQLHLQIVDKIHVGPHKPPFLLSLSFITKEQLPFQVKATQYSTIYSLSFDKLMQILRETKHDFQYYCFMRDKSRSATDEFQVLQCQDCHNGYHFKFSCPMLHYIPNKHKVVVSQLYRLKKSVPRQRENHIRTALSFSCFDVYKYFRVKALHIKQSQKMIAKNKNQIKRKNALHIENDDFNIASIDEELAVPDIQTFKQIRQMIRGQLAKVSKQSNDYQDAVWTIQTDLLCDYNNYFAQFNPNGIVNRKIKIKDKKTKTNYRFSLMEDY